jgi:hypothetical protein
MPPTGLSPSLVARQKKSGSTWWWMSTVKVTPASLRYTPFTDAGCRAGERSSPDPGDSSRAVTPGAELVGSDGCDGYQTSAARARAALARDE